MEQDVDQSEWIFTFYGNGFLYNMIRVIMGTVLPIADGRWEVSKMQDVLDAKDRNVAGPTLAARGLCLKEVHY